MARCAISSHRYAWVGSVARRSTVASPGSSLECSSSARAGVMPMPAVMTASFGDVRATGVKVPYGPSMETLVPGRRRERRRVPEPSSRTVMRACSSPGTAEKEMGCACHQVAPFQNRQIAYWPPFAPRRRSFRPLRWMENTPGAMASTPSTRR
ncbi:hypothetical protein ACFPRL_36515 [Pseudoclavibacter helvolus]